MKLSTGLCLTALYRNNTRYYDLRYLKIKIERHKETDNSNSSGVNLEYKQEQTSYRVEGIVRFEVKCEIVVSIHITSYEKVYEYVS